MSLIYKSTSFLALRENVNKVFRLKFSSLSGPNWPSNLPTLTLYTKEDCQLCEEAKGQLAPFLQSRLKLEEVDIAEDEKLFGLFRYEIPVFYLDKKFLCKNRIDLVKLEKALSKIEQ